MRICSGRVVVLNGPNLLSVEMEVRVIPDPAGTPSYFSFRSKLSYRDCNWASIDEGRNSALVMPVLFRGLNRWRRNGDLEAPTN
jgi:hypothetical protein